MIKFVVSSISHMKYADRVNIPSESKFYPVAREIDSTQRGDWRYYRRVLAHPLFLLFIHKCMHVELRYTLEIQNAYSLNLSLD